MILIFRYNYGQMAFSKPLCPNDAGGSDEKIDRQSVEKCAEHLPPDRKEQLVKLILKYRDTFSLRGNLGKTYVDTTS